MSQYTYNFPFSDTQDSYVNIYGYSPFIVTFKPSNIAYGNETVGKIIYEADGEVVAEREFTFSSLQDAVSGATAGIDSRSDFVYTFYNDVSGAVTSTFSITAITIPSFTKLVYSIRVLTLNSWLSQNPTLYSQGTSIFKDVHLVKNKAWGQDNQQLITIEGIKSETDRNGNTFYFNQFAFM